MLTIIDHPLLKRDLTILRDRNTPHGVFRSTLIRASTVLAIESSKDIPLSTHRIVTPLEPTEGYVPAAPICIISILRAGLGMVEGFLAMFPNAHQGHIGMYRDEDTHQPVPYYKHLPPNLHQTHLFLLDPMLATGGSAVEALGQLKEAGAQTCSFVCLLATQAGVDALSQAHPEVPIFTAELDRELDQHAFIRPGLGDAGNRTFGT